ncbi:MAG: pilus assembly FimT family protein [Gemmatimonadota bacterium]
MEPRLSRPFRFPIRGPSGSDGLTLLELLLVLTLLGVLITIALPSLSGGTSSHRVVRQAREVHAALAQTRARAVAEQRPHRFVLLADGRYQLQFRDDATGWTTYLTSLAPPDPLRVIGGSGGGVVFEPDGRVEAPATVQVGEPPRRHEIRILAGGLVRWSGPSS